MKKTMSLYLNVIKKYLRIMNEDQSDQHFYHMPIINPWTPERWIVKIADHKTQARQFIDRHVSSFTEEDIGFLVFNTYALIQLRSLVTKDEVEELKSLLEKFVLITSEEDDTNE
jgi:hypothetical protein